MHNLSPFAGIMSEINNQVKPEYEEGKCILALSSFLVLKVKLCAWGRFH
jgi:hypothetical protein